METINNAGTVHGGANRRHGVGV